MPNNFHYAASSYLDQWAFRDRGFYHRLKADADAGQSVDIGAIALGKFAAEYGVIRTLKKKESEPRLAAAFHALREVHLPSKEKMVETVESFAKTLSESYCVGKIPLSAASKFSG